MNRRNGDGGQVTHLKIGAATDENRKPDITAPRQATEERHYVAE